ncbi:DinB family protein [Vibrio sp. WJH972]
MLSIIANSQGQLVGRELPVIQGCIETLEQGYECLEFLTDEQYLWSAKPHVNSSIGEHFRHLLDLFHAVNVGMSESAKNNEPLVIDYNLRRRGHIVETSREQALLELSQLIQWLETLSEQELKTSVDVLTEVSIIHTDMNLMTSTLEREITFAALHATHHYAMTKVTTSLLDLNVSDDFGFAPATLSYLRGQ